MTTVMNDARDDEVPVVLVGLDQRVCMDHGLTLFKSGMFSLHVFICHYAGGGERQ